MTEQNQRESGNGNRFTVLELKEAQALLQRRKDSLAQYFRQRDVAAVRMVDNFVRDTETHYPVSSDALPIPKLEVQFLNPLYMESDAMQPGALVAVMERYISSRAFIYRLTHRPYRKLPENWHSEFVEELQVNLRR